MSQGSKPVNITILDKEYLIACNDEEREQLHHAADFLNGKLKELKKTGKVIGAERIAVMTALNITSEYLAFKQQASISSSQVDSTLKRLQNKINNALHRESSLEDLIQD